MTSSLLKNWNPLLAAMENKCHHIDGPEGGQIFLKDQIKNLWVTLQENQPDKSLIQAIEH